MQTKYELLKEKVRKMILMEGLEPGICTTCQYEIILESQLKGVVDRVCFRTLNLGLHREYITEIKIKHRDSFVFDEWGMYLLNSDSTDDVKFAEHTYCDPYYFEQADRNNAAALYQGDLSLYVNNALVIAGQRTDIFRLYMQVSDRVNAGISGMRELQESVLLIGSKNIQFNLDLPRHVDFGNTFTRVRLRLRGILIMNSTLIT